MSAAPTTPISRAEDGVKVKTGEGRDNVECSPHASYIMGLRDLSNMPHVSVEIGDVIRDAADLLEHLAGVNVNLLAAANEGSAVGYRTALFDCAKLADDEATYRHQCKRQAQNRKAKGEARDFESMAIACVQVAAAIRAKVSPA